MPSLIQISGRNRTRSSGQSGSRSASTSARTVNAGADANDALTDSDTVTDSHGVSDPSGHARGHWKRAHRGRSRHGSSCDTDRGRCLQWAAKRRRPSCVARAARQASGTSRRFNRVGGRFPRWAAAGRAILTKQIDKVAHGDNLNFRGRPPGRPLLFVDQATSTRGERWRYCRESSTHSTRPCSAFDGVARMCDPAIQRVFGGIVQPLPVEGPKPRSPEGVRRGQVAVVAPAPQSRRGASARGTATRASRRSRVRGGPPGARGRRAGRPSPSLRELSWKQQSDRPSEEHPEQGIWRKQEQPEVHRHGSRHQVDEHVGVERRQHADRQLVGK